MRIQEQVYKTLHAVPFVCGPIANNTFLLYDEESRDCVVIDPSFHFDRVLAAAENLGYTPREYWLTHGHYDHFAGTAYPASAEKEIPARMHPLDMPLFIEGKTSMRRAIPFIASAPVPKTDLEDGMILNVGNFAFRVLFTPGHAPGHCCFYCEEAGWLFSGDLVFYHSYGRTDLTGGDEDTLMKSIRERILTLPPETLIMPGHEDFTTVRDEEVYY